MGLLGDYEYISEVLQWFFHLNKNLDYSGKQFGNVSSITPLAQL